MKNFGIKLKYRISEFVTRLIKAEDVFFEKKVEKQRIYANEQNISYSDYTFLKNKELSQYDFDLFELRNKMKINEESKEIKIKNDEEKLHIKMYQFVKDKIEKNVSEKNFKKNNEAQDKVKADKLIESNRISFENESQIKGINSKDVFVKRNSNLSTINHKSSILGESHQDSVFPFKPIDCNMFKNFKKYEKISDEEKIRLESILNNIDGIAKDKVDLNTPISNPLKSPPPNDEEISKIKSKESFFKRTIADSFFTTSLGMTGINNEKIASKGK